MNTQRTCTTGPIPSPSVEAEARRFEPRPGVALIYIVRGRWSDVGSRVPVDIDGAAQIETIPDSVVRVQLEPGVHRLSLTADATIRTWDVEVHERDVRFVEIEGADWSWGANYRWSDADVQGARRRALESKLIADLKVGR